MFASRSHVDATPPSMPRLAQGVEDDVATTLIFTAVNSTTKAVRFDQSMTTYITDLANAHAKVRLVGVNGDGAVMIDQIQDLTPRLPNGDEIKVPERADAAIAATVVGLEQVMHTAATAPGEGLALGMATLTLTSPRFLVIVSPGLDSQDPLNFQGLGWDVKPEEVAAAVAPELPSLKGKSVTFVVVPSAGHQQPLRPARCEYREDVWRALLKSAEAKEVTFLYPSGDAPPADVPEGTPIGASAPTVHARAEHAGEVRRRHLDLLQSRQGGPHRSGSDPPRAPRLRGCYWPGLHRHRGRPHLRHERQHVHQGSQPGPVRSQSRGCWSAWASPRTTSPPVATVAATSLTPTPETSEIAP